MEPTTTKHSARTDDALQHETESLTHGATIVLHELGDIMGMPADEIAARSEFAIALRPNAFPNDAPTLLRIASEDGAPDWVCETLRRVDQVERYERIQQVWEAAGGHREQRTLPHERAHAEPDQREEWVAPVTAPSRGAAARRAAKEPDHDSYLGVVFDFVRAGWKLTARTARLVTAPLGRLGHG